MNLLRFVIYALLIAIAFILLLHYESSTVNALEAKGKSFKKVKCKEQVDEALRQYWNKDQKNPNEHDKDDDNDDNKDNDDDDDNDNNDENGTLNEQEKSDEDDVDNSADKEEDDNDDDDDNDDNDDDNENSKEQLNQDDYENDENGKNIENQENDDDDDDDNDENSDNENYQNDENEINDDEKKVLSQTKSSKMFDKREIEVKKEQQKNVKSIVQAQTNNVKKNDENDDDDDDNDDGDDNDKDNNSAEFDADELAKQQHVQKKSRAHVDDILKVYEIGSQDDNLEQNLIQSIFRDLKRIYEQTVKPLESIYKYRQITTRLITDAEIFSKPMVLFLGGKSTGKSSLVNYLLGIDDTPWQIKTGPESETKFTILSYGENYTHLTPIELAADFTFSSLQRFGENFVKQYIDAHRLPINILQKMTIIDSPGLVDIIPQSSGKQIIDNEVYQWFIDRSDVIYIVIDVSQLHLSSSLRLLLDQLKGREVRFLIGKSDMASHSQIISMFGQLLWVLSPIMSADRPPQVYALTTEAQDSYDEFLDMQESSWLKDLSYELSGISRIESHIGEVRRHAVRVRNHAKLVDCYLNTFYKNKGLFTFGASSRQLASDISENPHQYQIYSGALIGQLQNVSRYDLPDPGVYRDFFRSNPLIDFKPLHSTCSYFRGCPIDRLDVSIAYDLPELVTKYKKLTKNN